MSLLVFPILPLVQSDKEIAGGYSTTVKKSVSGKRIAASWRVSREDTISVKIQLRDWATAPVGVGTWGTISEPALFRYFVDQHKGSADSFLLDNSTGLYLPGGASQPRVYFVEDKPPVRELLRGLYEADVEWETVL